MLIAHTMPKMATLIKIPLTKCVILPAVPHNSTQRVCSKGLLAYCVSLIRKIWRKNMEYIKLTWTRKGIESQQHNAFDLLLKSFLFVAGFD